MGMKFSDFATLVFSVPWFRGSARSCHISFHTVKYYAHVLYSSILEQRLHSLLKLDPLEL